LLKRQLEQEQLPGPSAWSAEEMQVESPRANYEAYGPGQDRVDQAQQIHASTVSLGREHQKQVDISADSLRAKPVKPLARCDGDNPAAVS
jgi:DUF971 family protein